jgi:DNA-binding CsgD family transcriptional regulator
MGLGFGCFLALNALTIWNPLSFLSHVFVSVGVPFYVTLEIGFIGSFFLYVRLVFVQPQLSKAAPLRLTFILLVCALGLLLLGLYAPFWSGAISVLLGAFLLGAGTSLGFICWMRIFAAYDLRTAQNAVLIGSIFSALPHLLFTFMLTDKNILALMIALVLAPVCLALLFFNVRRIPQRESSVESVAGQVQEQQAHDAAFYKSVFSAILIPIFCALLFGLIGPAIGSAVLDAQTSVQIRALTSQAGNVLAAVILLIGWRGFHSKMNLVKIYLSTFPVLATVFLLVPLINMAFWPVLSVFSDFLFTLISVTMMMYCIEISHERGAKLEIVYGVFAGCVYLSRLLGVGIGTATASMAVSETLRIAVVGVSLFLFITILYFHIRFRAKQSKTQGDAPDTQERTSSDEKLVDVLAVRCKSVAKRFELSERESQVLELLAHGRDVPAIAKTLFIAPSTVQTYVKHLHRNLGVHSRQELIDFVSGSDEEFHLD